jgi:predicted flap endonuclease-1-like 5' DNA nuclease
MGVVMNVIWSLLALIIAAVVCYLIYDEYIVDKPEESDAEKEIEADLKSIEAEAGVTGYGSELDSRAADAAPAIAMGGAAVIGESDDTDAAEGSDDASADEAADDVVVVAAADVAVEETTTAETVEEETADEVADEAPEEAVEEAAATMNAVVVEDSADEEVAAVEEEAVAERTVEVPLEVDDLTKIKGIGKVYAQRLNEAGIFTYQQIIDTDVTTLEEVAHAHSAASVHDWSRQASELI